MSIKSYLAKYNAYKNFGKTIQEAMHENPIIPAIRPGPMRKRSYGQLTPEDLSYVREQAAVGDPWAVWTLDRYKKKPLALAGAAGLSAIGSAFFLYALVDPEKPKNKVAFWIVATLAAGMNAFVGYRIGQRIVVRDANLMAETGYFEGGAEVPPEPTEEEIFYMGG